MNFHYLLHILQNEVVIPTLMGGKNHPITWANSRRCPWGVAAHPLSKEELCWLVACLFEHLQNKLRSFFHLEGQTSLRAFFCQHKIHAFSHTRREQFPNLGRLHVSLVVRAGLPKHTQPEVPGHTRNYKLDVSVSLSASNITWRAGTGARLDKALCATRRWKEGVRSLLYKLKKHLGYGKKFNPSLYLVYSQVPASPFNTQATSL